MSTLLRLAVLLLAVVGAACDSAHALSEEAFLAPDPALSSPAPNPKPPPPEPLPPCVCEAAPAVSSPLAYGPLLTLTPKDRTVRLDTQGEPTTVTLPIAASTAGLRFTVKVVGSGLTQVLFMPAVDPATGLTDLIDKGPNHYIEGGHPAITLEAHGDTDGDGFDVAGWILIGP